MSRNSTDTDDFSYSDDFISCGDATEKFFGFAGFFNSDEFIETDDFIDFLGLPYDLSYIIFKKFDYNAFATFGKTCQFAQSMCSRSGNSNNYLTANCLSVQKGPNVFTTSFHYYDKYLNRYEISIANCPDHVTVKAPLIKINQCITRDIRDFLIHKVEGTRNLEFQMSHHYDHYLAAVFKEVTFDRLDIDLPFSLDEFPYDTSRVKTVNVFSCASLQHFFFSIKAEESVTLSCWGVSTEVIMDFIRDQMSTYSPVVKRKISIDEEIYEILMDEIQIKLEVLGSLCYKVYCIFPEEPNVSRWAVRRTDEQEPFMRVDVYGRCVIIEPLVFNKVL